MFNWRKKLQTAAKTCHLYTEFQSERSELAEVIKQRTPTKGTQTISGFRKIQSMKERSIYHDDHD